MQAWREAYADHLPADFLARLEEGPRAAKWAEIISDDATDVFVAELDGEIVGWASASRGRDDDKPVDRELEGIYVLERVYGTGAGQQLHDIAVGGAPAYLWMLDDNPRAERFYVKNGFSRDGIEKDRRLGDHAVRIVRLVRG